jgi:hypothetical protein
MLMSKSPNHWLLLLKVLPVAALAAWVLAWYVQVALIAPPDFDGALNFNVSASVAAGDGYGSFYERFALFPIETQTNGPLVLPAAASIALFGLTPIGLQLVNLLYVIALFLLVVTLQRRAVDAPGWLWPILVASLVLQVPGMSQFAMFGYGEVAAAAWALSAVVALSGQLTADRPRLLLFGGVLLGMSFLTKTVSLIWFPSIAGAFCLLVWSKRGFLPAVRAGVWICAGILIPLFAWELYRAVSLGSLTDYGAWWEEQFNEIRKQAGVRDHYADTPTWQAKLALHSAALAGFLRVDVSTLAALATAWSAVVAFAAFRLRERIVPLYLLSVLASVALIYFYWWLLITPTEMMWLRRVMLGLAFAMLALGVAVASLWQYGVPGRAAAGLGLLLVFVLVAPGQLVWERPDPAPSAREDFLFADAVKALPEDALVFGSGWWQAPVTALLSGRKVYNEEAWTPQQLVDAGASAYLVLDRSAVVLGSHLHKRLGWRCDCEPVHLGSGGRIYRIRALFESEAGSSATTRRFGPDSDVFVAGFSSSDDGGFRWAEKDAQLRLPEPVRAERWVLSVLVPSGGYLDTPDGSGLNLQLDFGACGTQSLALNAGENVRLLTLECQTPVAEIALRASDHLDPDRIRPDTRRLAYLFRSIEVFPPAP